MSSKKNYPTLPRRNGKILFALLMRMHFYVGLLVGPFILVAALSGIVYVLTPSVESWLYRDALTVSTQDAPQPLARQIETAQWVIGQTRYPPRFAPHRMRTVPRVLCLLIQRLDPPSIGLFL